MFSLSSIVLFIYFISAICQLLLCYSWTFRFVVCQFDPLLFDHAVLSVDAQWMGFILDHLLPFLHIIRKSELKSDSRGINHVLPYLMTVLILRHPVPLLS